MGRILLLAVLLVLFASCHQNNNSALIPTPRDDGWWQSRHQQILKQNIEKNPELILIGNSILNLLDDSSRHEVWEKYLDKYRTVNMGFSGDRTENVIWRLENGELDGINPKVTLLLIGTNNTDGNHYLEITQPKELAAATWKIISIIREKLPDTKILLLGIFPYGYKPNYRNNIILATNKITSKFPARDSHINYCDIGNIFLDANGKVEKSLLPDFLHPNTEGHMLMFETLEDDIEELLK